MAFSFFYSQEFDLLVRWLTKHLKLDQPKLFMRLSRVSDEPMDEVDLIDLYNKLRACSTLEVDNIALRTSVHCSTHNNLLQLNLLGTGLFVADDIFWIHLVIARDRTCLSHAHWPFVIVSFCN